jgi:hypothetical protein
MLTDRWSTSEKVSENGDYVVVDTSSLNGTDVNRKPVESEPPANGRDSNGQVSVWCSAAGPRRTDIHLASHQQANSVMLAKPDAVGGRHPHATGPVRSSRWGAMKPTDQTNHSRNRLPETHVFFL